MMYYLPHYPVYMLADWREDMEKVRFGQYGRTIEDLSTNNIVYPSNTKTVVVFCSEDSPTYEVLRRQNPLERIAIPGDLYFFLARSPNTRFEVGGFLFSNGSRGKNDRE